MEKEQFKTALEEVRKISPKRKFSQSVDLIINLKGLDLKKPEEQIDLFVPLPHQKGKKVKVCALVGPELIENAKASCDRAIQTDDFQRIGVDKKATRKLAKEYDFFIAQANIMPMVAKAFGRVFGPKGKMPNPKAGCVVPPSANLKPVYDRLQNIVRATARVQPCIQCIVGTESMKDEDIIDNVMVVYNQVIQRLPAELNNLRSIFMKLTMGKCVRVGGKAEEAVVETKKKKTKKEERADLKEAKKEEKKAKEEKEAADTESKPKKAKKKKEEEKIEG
jgi:large subunit ribosomal protein L1